MSASPRATELVSEPDGEIGSLCSYPRSGVSWHPRLSFPGKVNDKSPLCREPCLSPKSLNSHSDIDNYITSSRPFLHLQNREKQKDFPGVRSSVFAPWHMI